MIASRAQWIGSVLVLLAAATIAPQGAHAQEVLAWDATKYFQYNIESVLVDSTQLCNNVAFAVDAICPVVKVVFSVTDPTRGNYAWDIKTETPFTQPGGVSRLGIDIGWSTAEYVNTWSRFSLAPVLFGQGVGAALPIQVNALVAAKPCSPVDCPGVPDLTRRFWVSAAIPPRAAGVTGSGVVAIEGHPAWQIVVNGAAVVAPVPVKSVFTPFAITDPAAVPRRRIVDFEAKCRACHDGAHAGIPRLGMHGGNRNEEPGVCVICHNPNQTDVPYRTVLSPASPDPLVTAGRLGRAPEVSVDFKRMVHAIHAGGFRKNPFVVIGFRGSVNDFSGVRFPAKLSDCRNCHVEVNGKGTFELPLHSSVLGSTVKTGSEIGIAVDVDPSNNLRITPIASVCSSCHDSKEVAQHMLSRGASFGVLQSDSRYGRERCVTCHGPGRDKDVRKVHEVGAGDDD